MVFATFVNCTIVGVEWLTLQSNSVSLPIQKFDKCYLKYNSFEKMSFKKFDFLQSSMIDCNFLSCNLSEADFKNCNLQNTEFSDCDLKNSDFRRATGYSINLADNRTKGARFSYPEVVNLLKSFDIRIEN